MESSSENLAAAMASLGIELPADHTARLESYCRLLWDWNAKLNLTRHTDFRKFAARDLVDTLAFSRFLSAGERVLDVGTGGGVPGVVLAILRPDLSIALCESVAKRVRAVGDILGQLGLDVPLFHARAEDLVAGPGKYNTLLVRAVARLDRLLRWFRPHWQHFDRMLVLKGPAWVEERGQARHLGLLGDLALRKLTSYPLYGTDAESVLLQICPKDRLLDEKQCRLSQWTTAGKKGLGNGD
jgi:16S rRNA (guanine527-N7)-methyltransferase